MHDNSPKVSFIVLFYNQAEYVKKTLDSMINQDYDNYEIVVRDDNSKDNTSEELRKYVEANNSNVNIKVDYGTENLGIIKSINKVLAMSDGNIIALQGGDDISLRERLSKSVELMTKYNVDLVAVDAAVINEDDETIFKSFYVRNEAGLEVQNKWEFEVGVRVKLEDHVYLNNSRSENVGTSCFGGFGITFNRSILNYFNGFFPESVQYEDRLLTFLAHMNKGCIYYDRQLVLYRRTRKNVSAPLGKNDEQIIKNMSRITQMETSVCKAQIAYLENGGIVNSRYSKDIILKVLKLEYSRNMYVLKSVTDGSIQESRYELLKVLLGSPYMKIHSKLKHLAAFFIPYLHKKKVLDEYYIRINFFGNN